MTPKLRLKQRHAQIAEALASGPLTQAQIAEAIGLSQPRASQVLNALVADGHVRMESAEPGVGSKWRLRYGLPR